MADKKSNPLPRIIILVLVLVVAAVVLTVKYGPIIAERMGSPSPARIEKLAAEWDYVSHSSIDDVNKKLGVSGPTQELARDEQRDPESTRIYLYEIPDRRGGEVTRVLVREQAGRITAVRVVDADLNVIVRDPTRDR
jgi:hypothetical protein